MTKKKDLGYLEAFGVITFVDKPTYPVLLIEIVHGAKGGSLKTCIGPQQLNRGLKRMVHLLRNTNVNIACL